MDGLDDTSPSYADVGRQCIRELKAKHPNLSSAQIAKRVGIGQPTFCRIENGQTANPSLASISKLLSALGKSYKISEAIEALEPSLASVLRDNLSHRLDVPVMAGDTAKYFADPDYRPILFLALSRSGTTREEIYAEHGSEGIKRLDEMIALKAVVEERGIVRSVYHEEVASDQDALRDALVDCIERRYDPEKFGRNENWLSLQTESVDKEKVMGLIRDKLRKTYEEIREDILYSPKYYGTDKVFVGMVADSLLKGGGSKDVISEVKQ